MKILYLMHVDWRWIWQRPHELAVGLSQRGHEVSVFYVPSLSNKVPARPDGAKLATASIKKRPLPTMPLLRFSQTRKLSRWLQKAFIRTMMRARDYDMVWITHPVFAPMLPSGTLITRVYDCMDLAVGFVGSASEVRNLELWEAKACVGSDLVISSSEFLAGHLYQSYGRKPVVVRNGTNQTVSSANDPGSPQRHPASAVKLLYVGTIAEWFDFDLCVEALDQRPELSITLVGPAMCHVPRHARLVHLGIRPHDELASLATLFDAFVMPFTVNRLVEGVDPVKLYEYLAWRRPVIAVRYAELDHFGEAICRYTGLGEFLELVDRIEAGVDSMMLEVDEVAAFLKKSRWEQRVDEIDNLLLGLTTSKWRDPTS